MEFEITPAVAYWLGAILTDGHFGVRRVGRRHYTQHVVIFTVIDREFCEAVNDGCEEMIGRRYAITPRPPVKGSQRSLWLMQMTNQRMWAFGYEQTEGKLRVPRWMYEAEREVQRQFLAGVMDGDGWVGLTPYPARQQRREGSRGYMAQIGVGSCDPWVFDLKRLADVMGLPTHGPDKKTMPKGKPWREQHHLRFSVQPFVCEQVPLRIERKRERLDGLLRHLESSETARSASRELWHTDRREYNRQASAKYRAKMKIQSALTGDSERPAEMTGPDTLERQPTDR